MAKKKTPKFEKELPGEISIADFLRKFQSLDRVEQDAMIRFFELVDEGETDPDKILDYLLDDLYAGKDDDFEDEPEDDGDDELDYPPFLVRKNIEKYTLRVSLKGIKPTIYRKFSVPSNISLRHLGELIVGLMGWDGSHAHQFIVKGSYFMPDYMMEEMKDSMFGSGDVLPQETFTLSDILNEKGKSVTFEYDFGDSWQHEVKISSISEYDVDEEAVQFVKGERACPPDDCGGIGGYEMLVDIIEKKSQRKRLTQDEKERLEWYYPDYENGDLEFLDDELMEMICEDFC